MFYVFRDDFTSKTEKASSVLRPPGFFHCLSDLSMKAIFHGFCREAFAKDFLLGSVDR